MEGSEQQQHSLTKPCIDDSQHTLVEENHDDLGLGFQSPHSLSADHAPNLDPPSNPSSTDLADKITNVDQDVQNQEPPISDEVQNQKPIGEDGQDEELASEELLYMNTVCEELLNLVLEEEGKVREKVSENGGSSFLGEDHEAGSEGSGLEENDYAKDEEVTHSERSESEVQVVNGNYGRYQHPVRPGAEECAFYMRTGMCKFGPSCKFNHPPKKWNQGARDKVVKERQDYSVKLGQNECKYFMSGGCKFGKGCKFKHGTEKTPVSQIVDFNFLGLPIRPGERECPFYMRNGSCKYGSNCRFHHPDPSAAGVSDAGYANGGGSGSYQNASHSHLPSWSPRPSNDNNQYGPMMFPPTREVPPQPEWNAYKAPAYVAPQRRLPTPPAFNLDHLSAAEPNFFVNQQNRQQMPPVVVDELFPERPGQPECSFYLKTGTCKYKSACKFHHPKNRGVGRPAAASASFSLSDKGLPLRPDQNICSHYSRYGICKFGPACKFDHPKNYVPSSSVDFGMSGAPGGALLGGGGMPMRL